MAYWNERKKWWGSIGLGESYDNAIASELPKHNFQIKKHDWDKPDPGQSQEHDQDRKWKGQDHDLQCKLPAQAGRANQIANESCQQ